MGLAYKIKTYIYMYICIKEIYVLAPFLLNKNDYYDML